MQSAALQFLATSRHDQLGCRIRGHPCGSKHALACAARGLVGSDTMKRLLSTDQFERLYRLLRGERKIHTKRRALVRRFLEAVLWLGRSGAQWRFLPTEYGVWNSV